MFSTALQEKQQKFPRLNFCLSRVHVLCVCVRLTIFHIKRVPIKCNPNTVTGLSLHTSLLQGRKHYISDQLGTRDCPELCENQCEWTSKPLTVTSYEGVVLNQAGFHSAQACEAKMIRQSPAFLHRTVTVIFPLPEVLQWLAAGNPLTQPLGHRIKTVTLVLYGRQKNIKTSSALTISTTSTMAGIRKLYMYCCKSFFICTLLSYTSDQLVKAFVYPVTSSQTTQHGSSWEQRHRL